MRVRGFGGWCAWSVAGLLLACESQPTGRAGPPCGTTVLRAEVATSNRDPLDVLLVVSDAPSMAEEQSVLARELPAIAHALASGVIAEDDRYRAQRDVHIGIVSADLGVDAEPGVPGCSPNGRDASLQLGGPAGDACGEPPGFVRYLVPTPTQHPLVAPPDSAPRDAFASAVACSGALGSAGCGVVQPLEAALRALWPSGLSLQGTSHVAPELAREPQGQRDNRGFLRNEPPAGLSFLHVVVVSDSDDCSLQHPAAFAQALNAGALASATACAQRPELLHQVERYARGLRALRPNLELLVGFAAITGVPEDFALDWSSSDGAERVAQLSALLADPRMQPSAGPDGALRPVCENAQASATPAPRLVELARSFGENGAVVSICSPDWRLALAPVFASSGLHTSGSGLCLPRKPVRDASGLTQCDVRWELPLRERAPAGSPSACGERPFLREHAAQPRTADGRAVCEVAQLAVTGAPAAPRLAPGEGWFFDDFSRIGPICNCAGAGVGCNAIFFVPDVPPAGVVVRVECFESHCLARDGAPCEPAECELP